MTLGFFRRSNFCFCYLLTDLYLLLRRSHRPSRLEALPAKHRAPLRWPEGNRRFLAALRTGGLRFGSRRAAASAPTAFCPLCLAPFAALWFVFKSLVGEKHLLAAGKNELGATFRTLQHLIVEFHARSPWTLIGRGPGSCAIDPVGGTDPYPGKAGHGSLGPAGEE